MFSVAAESTLPLIYQWVFNGEPIPNETNSVLILSPLHYAQNGYYNVIVSNSAEVVSSTKAQLTVAQTVLSSSISYYNFGGGYGSNAQNFLLQFTNVMVASVGSFALYSLNSDGTVAAFDTENSDSGVPAQDLAVPSGLFDVVAISSAQTHVLALRSDGTVAAWGSGPTNVPRGLLNVTAIAAGEYSDIVLQSNGTTAEFGEAGSPTPTLSNVVAVAEGLALYADGTVAEVTGNGAQLVPGLSNVIAIAAGFGSLALKADGTVVGWNGLATNPLPDVSNVVALSMNVDSYSRYLALHSDGTLAEPPYSAPIPFGLSNVFAIAVSPTLGGIAMVSNGAPVFTVRPGNQFPTNGGTIWLHARAVGVQPMSYQWQLNGTNVAGATNADLTITNAQGANSGQYGALASNNIGSASSRVASVSVMIPPSQVQYTLAQALDATNLKWSTFGNADWFAETNITEDGIAAAQSGRITNSMLTDLQTTVIGPGTLTFWWKVSSEQLFDVLSFWNGTGPNATASISGEVDWEQKNFLIGPGSQTLTWVYSKDPDVSVGLDAGWLAHVSFTPTVPAQLGVPMLLPNGSLLFSVYATNGSMLGLSNSSSVIFAASSNMIDWIPLTNGPTLTNGGALVNDPAVSNSPVRFYRLLRQ
jgi:hypothetical protein